MILSEEGIQGREKILLITNEIHSYLHSIHSDLLKVLEKHDKEIPVNFLNFTDKMKKKYFIVLVWSYAHYTRKKIRSPRNVLLIIKCEGQISKKI